jgi:amidohydrolase
MINLKEQIKEKARGNKDTVIEWRRHIHQHPELSFREYNTAKYIAEKLRFIGIEPQEGVATTGLIAEIKGLNPEKKVVALRADIDALPILEKNEVDYKSKNEGVMHACGHDVHSASLLGCATILNQLRDQFEGTVKLIFQPGEERLPGGASLMIKEGVLENPKPSSIIGQHVMPLIPAGKVGFRPGQYMASADEIYIRVKGKGGHAAIPELNIDPVLISAHLITSLQQVISRNCPPKIPSVLSIGKVEAKGATNVIPDEVYMEGTFRTLNEEWRTRAHDIIKKMAKGIVESMGGKVEIEVKKGYPYLENEIELTERLKKLAIDFLGEENVVDLDIWMAGEDFAFYSHHIDACFYRLGTRNEEKGIISPVHTPTFNIDEEALELGPALMAWLTINELSTNS